MNRMNCYAQMFVIAALWNIGISMPFIIWSLFNHSFFAIFGLTVPPTLAIFHIMAGLITTFGVGYYMVGMNYRRNHGIVVLGIIGKVMFSSLVLAYFFKGEMNWICVVIAMVDFFFVLLFACFLRDYSRRLQGRRGVGGTADATGTM